MLLSSIDIVGSPSYSPTYVFRIRCDIFFVKQKNTRSQHDDRSVLFERLRLRATFIYITNAFSSINYEYATRIFLDSFEFEAVYSLDCFNLDTYINSRYTDSWKEKKKNIYIFLIYDRNISSSFL